MINNRRTICILGGTGTVGVTACKVLSKLGYSLRVSVRNIETIKDTGMYMAPNIQLFELDIDKESNIGKFFKGSDLVIGAIGPSADYSEKMLLGAMAENIPYVDPGGIHLIRKMRNSSMKGTAIVGSGIFPGLSGWMLSSVLKEAFNDDLIEMIKNIVSTVDSLMSWNYQSVEKILNQLTKMHFRTAKLSETLLLAIKAR